MPRARHGSEAVDIDHGQLVGQHLNRFATVMNLHELAPVDGRAPRGCDWRRCEWFTQVGENLPDRPGLRDERDQPDVTAAVRALKRKLLPHPRHELGPRNPRRVVRAWLFRRVMRVA